MAAARIVVGVPIEAGMHAVVEATVVAGDTAESLGSGDVEVLGSPRLIALCEQACCRAIVGALGPAETTVGLRVEFSHVAPTRVGSVVKAEATLERVAGRRLCFTVAATDGCGLIAAGKMTRVAVERTQFLDKAR
ncbi:MAG: thioesterase [Acidimicrobiales bacterium]